MALRFLADHCISSFIVQNLQGRGYDVFRLRDVMLKNSPDRAVILKAQELLAVLLSLNGDFADIVTYPPKDFKGIVTLQMRNHPEIIPQLMTRLLGYLELYPTPEHYVGKLLIVEVDRIRIRE